jgi:hypothetical protein
MFPTQKLKFLATPALLASLAFIGGCDLNGSSSSSSSGSTPLTEQPEISEKVLDSAASFLGAATGKEIPLSVDTVVFINSALGLNDVPTDPKNLYGDLWLLVRDEYGAPVLDGNGCIQPIASETITWPDGNEHDTVPMVLEEFDDAELDFACTVVESYEVYTIELEIGRLNMIRTVTQNPTVFARALAEAIDNINASDSIKTDPAGRLILVSDVDGEEPVENTIDSPRENLALYYALLKEGRIAGYGPESRQGGQLVAPEWMEIRDDLELGELAYLRDGTPGRTGGVSLYEGYADLSNAMHNRMTDYVSQIVSYVQYIDSGSTCLYEDQVADAWTRIFDMEGYYGENIAGFTTHADDARRTIVFTHDVIQDMPETPLETLPPSSFDLMHAAAAFLGGASNKSVPLTIDGLVFINTVLGLNEGVEFTYKGEIFGDLWQLVRDDNGVPVLDTNGCPQPVSVNGGTVPMELDETGECIIVAGFEDDVIELELGRLNVARVALTNPRVLDRTLNDVMNSINASVGLKLDLSGRLAYGVDDGTGTDTASYYQTVDSPLAGLALYSALMRWGKLEGTIEVMDEGSWVPKQIAIELPDQVLADEGLLFLKHGTAACQNDPADCGAKNLPVSGYIDYSSFTHTTETIYSGVDVSYVERQPDDLSCAYTDKTDDLWIRVLYSDAYTGSNIEAFVKQAEDTRNVIQFIHTVIQDPVAI